MVAGIVGPIRERSKGVGEFAEQVAEPLVLPEFLARRRVIGKLLAEKRPRPGGKIRQQPDAWPEQIHGAREPIAPRAGPFLAPQPAPFQFGFHVRHKLFDGKLL